MTQDMTEADIQDLLSVIVGYEPAKPMTITIPKKEAIRLYGEEIVKGIIRDIGESGLELKLINGEAEHLVKWNLYPYGRVA